MSLRSRIDAGEPLSRQDVPRWLELNYRIPAIPNAFYPGTLQPDPDLPGLAEARRATIRYVAERDAPELRSKALLDVAHPVKAAYWRRALAGEREAARMSGPTASERWQMLFRFVTTLHAGNPDLPLRAVLMLTWWEGYKIAPPTTNSVRALRRLLKRNSDLAPLHAVTPQLIRLIVEVPRLENGSSTLRLRWLHTPPS